MKLTPESFAGMVDHTLLSPGATEAEIRTLCEDAQRFATASVCVNASHVPLAVSELTGSTVAVCTVTGFPLGADQPAVVAMATSLASEQGATEIDVVIPIGRVIQADDLFVSDYLSAVRGACEASTLKVIIESAALTDEQIVRASRLAIDAGADFVKTSTGFHAAGGATVEAVRLMCQTVGPELGLKASGGIRTLADVEAMLGAGATRLGMSATAAVVDELSTQRPT